MDTDAERMKLPFWRTVGDSFRLFLDNVATLLRHTWAALAAIAVATGLLQWLAFPFEQAAGDVGGSWMSVIAIPMATMIFTAMIAVPWHRLVLGGEPMAGHGVDFGPRVLSYTIWGVLGWAGFAVFFVPMIAAVPTDVGDQLTGGQSTVLLLSLIGVLASSFVVTRLTPKLVAVALSEPDKTLAVVWHRTSGSFWRLMWGMLVTVVPLFVAILLVSLVWPEDVGSRVGYSVRRAFDAAIGGLLAVPSLTFLSLAYRHLITRA